MDTDWKFIIFLVVVLVGVGAGLIVIEFEEYKERERMNVEKENFCVDNGYMWDDDKYDCIEFDGKEMIHHQINYYKGLYFFEGV